LAGCVYEWLAGCVYEVSVVSVSVVSNLPMCNIRIGTAAIGNNQEYLSPVGFLLIVKYYKSFLYIHSSTVIVSLSSIYYLRYDD